MMQVQGGTLPVNAPPQGLHQGPQVQGPVPVPVPHHLQVPQQQQQQQPQPQQQLLQQQGMPVAGLQGHQLQMHQIRHALPAEPLPLPPKRQAVVDRLRRRIENYRRRQNECVPRFDQSFSGVCEQQGLETSALQRRFLEGKAKRAAKKGGDRRQTDQPLQQQQTLQQQQHPHSLTSNLHSSVHVQKFLKRPSDDGVNANNGGGVGASGRTSPANKVARTTGPQSGEGLTKFSVEIVQQLEFTTSAADSQPQQISTNVTVKALTNASLKSETGPPLLECKREQLDPEFVDLEQCAAALEKDAAANFPGFTDLIGDDGGDEIITSDAFKDLISEISDYPELFDFEDKCGDSVNNDGLLTNGQLKTEDGVLESCAQQVNSNGDDSGMGGVRGGFGNRTQAQLSPAAQTLKQMAEQHQHKQMGLGPRVRSPYADFHEYLSGPGGQFRKQEVKQEPNFSTGGYKQYSPYGSPGSAGRGSPGYLPRSNYGGASPPRPPSGPPPQQTNSNLHINQAQHLHISHGIQVSAGQQMHLNGDVQGSNVSVAAHQGMYFGQSPGSGPSPHQGTPSPHPSQGGGVGNETYTVSQSQTINFTQQTLRQRQQQQQQQSQQQAQGPATSPMGPVGSPMGAQTPMTPNPQNIPTSMNGSPVAPGQNMTGMGIPNANAMNSMGPMQMNREQHAKFLQQQQMLRAQAMQQGVQGHLRPPPPDYKATQVPMTAQMGGPMQTRFSQPIMNKRSPHQAMPPTGPIMRAGTMMYGSGMGNAGPGNGNRYPNPGGPEWRHHLAMQQHQQIVTGFPRHPNMNSTFNNMPHQAGSFPMNASNTMQQQQQLQQQQHMMRTQQQMMPSHLQQQQQQLPPHLMAQQSQMINMQGQMSNIHMNQTQNISLQSQQGPGSMGNQQNPNSQSGNNSFALQNTTSNSTPGFPSQSDFNLDFFENMPSGDPNNITAQELLNSLESDPGFSLQDIL